MSFLHILDIVIAIFNSVNQNASFNSLVASMDFIKIKGISLVNYLPLIMVIFSLITLFNGYSRFGRFIGLHDVDEITSSFFPCSKLKLNDEEERRYNTGKTLVTNELKRLKIKSNEVDQSSKITSKSKLEMKKYTTLSSTSKHGLLNDSDDDTVSFNEVGPVESSHVFSSNNPWAFISFVKEKVIDTVGTAKQKISDNIASIDYIGVKNSLVGNSNETRDEIISLPVVKARDFSFEDEEYRGGRYSNI